MQLSDVRLSVCMSVPSDRRTPLLKVCCCGPGGHEILIDCCSSGGRMRAVPRCQHSQVAVRHKLVVIPSSHRPTRRDSFVTSG